MIGGGDDAAADLGAADRVGPVSSPSWRTANAALSASLVEDGRLVDGIVEQCGGQHRVHVVDGWLHRELGRVPTHPHDVRGRVIAAMRLAVPREQALDDVIVVRSGHLSPGAAQLDLGRGHDPSLCSRRAPMPLWHACCVRVMLQR